MKKRSTKKLSLSRETLRRLEETRLHNAAGAGTNQQSVCVCQCPASISFCDTDICASEGHTLCPACEM